MSDPTSNEPTPAAAPAPASPPSPEKLEQAQQVLGQILSRLEVPARLELKDAADGGISVAVFPEGAEVAGLQAGRRSHLVDALQFLANKIVNRPQGDKRWISVGIGGHPEPRAPRPPKGAAPQGELQGAPAQPQPAQPPRPPRERAGSADGGHAPKRAHAEKHGGPQEKPAEGGHAPKHAHPPKAPSEPEELKLDVPEDPALTALARAMAEKSARLGRFYAIAPIQPEDRARFLKATAGVEGVKVSAEGEGRARRVLFTPARPTPMPKKGVMPDYGDEEDAE